MNKRNVLSALALVMIMALCAVACAKQSDEATVEVPQTPTEGIEITMQNNVATGYKQAEEMTNFVDILMDSGQHIVIELDETEAPVTVENFKRLVSESFYDGIIFHRIIAGFMIQGGDPDGTGAGGSKEQIKGEFLSNGVNNCLSHTRGVVSMARTQIPDSASSQFFICHDDSTFLDGNYAAFGRVVYGMDEVDRIAALETNARDFPHNPPVMKTVCFVEPQA